jgi:G6PDH family F420-dependent oxidoreductase
MVTLGYALVSEMHAPRDLIRYAKRAEQAGFSFASVSDHFHPWLDVQGQSGFVWSMLGGISQVTTTMRVGTSVTCPIMRVHPAIIAQAAATTSTLFDGRFFLGLGTGENLNEHIIGRQWPPDAVRREMLAEAIEVIRGLWKGDIYSHRGTHFTVENARIYSLPPTPPEIYVAAAGVESAELAGKYADGLISTAPKKELVEAFQAQGNSGHRIGQLAVCWAPTEAEARQIVKKYWPNAGIPSAVTGELGLPAEFEAVAELVTEEQLAEQIVLGPDPVKHLEAINEFVSAGFDHVSIFAIGQDQEAQISFYEREVLPKVAQAVGQR